MMDSAFNPMLGVFLAAVGGVMGGSFYVPFGKVKRWSWETYWMIMGVASWVILPTLVAWFTVPRLPEIFFNSPVRSIVLAYLFGAMFGVGAVTFGLTMRYLGISLGMALIVGLGTAFATLVPPIVDGQFGRLLVTQSGITVLLGVAICLGGTAICGYAGVRKEHELTDEQKAGSIRDFALVKGFAVATISAMMSAGTIYGINAGRAIARVAVDLGAPDAYQNNPVLMIVLAGGFTVNSLWCLVLGIKNRSVHQYVAGSVTGLLANYSVVALAAILWYSQMFLYGMSRTKMGVYDFASWSLVTAFMITSSTLWGLALKEWSGVSRRTLLFLCSGMLVLIFSAGVTGAGGYLARTESPGPSEVRTGDWGLGSGD
jgi:L-rhamnose-H+ transport protein